MLSSSTKWEKKICGSGKKHKPFSAENGNQIFAINSKTTSHANALSFQTINPSHHLSGSQETSSGVQSINMIMIQKKVL